MKKIIVVEDDRLFASHIQRTLTTAGYKVQYVHHAPAAINLVDTTTPDVIVLDMLLGGSTAMPLLNELASHDDLAHIPVVLLTSLATEVDELSLKPYGVREVLDKAKATPQDIVAAVGACLK